MVVFWRNFGSADPWIKCSREHRNLLQYYEVTAFPFCHNWIFKKSSIDLLPFNVKMLFLIKQKCGCQLFSGAVFLL